MTSNFRLFAGYCSTAFCGASTNQSRQGRLPRQRAKHKNRAVPQSGGVLAQFKIAEDLEIEQLLAEPIVRQPVFLNFDERGRMWVVQYLQYPDPGRVENAQQGQVLESGLR